MKEGIYKKVNDSIKSIDYNQFIVLEPWTKTRDRLKKVYPNAKIKYSYKTKLFTILFNLPSDFKNIKDFKLTSK